MFPALWIAKTGLDAQQTRMSVVSNNLANVNTTGFKRSRASFEDLLYQNIRQPGGAASQQNQLPSGLTTGTGVRVVSTEKFFAQGGLLQTGNALDVAVNGRGMFQILLPDGTSAYTRDGSFQIDSQGQIVTNGGYVVQPALQVPEGGIVAIMLVNNEVGTIQPVADFAAAAQASAVAVQIACARKLLMSFSTMPCPGGPA